MSDDIQTFFEGARPYHKKKFTTQTRYTHNTYIYIVTQKLEHISWQFWGSFFDKLLRNKGSFTNYVDQILTYFDHLPTYRGLSWTFSALPTPCPRGHRKTWPPTPYVQSDSYSEDPESVRSEGLISSVSWINGETKQLKTAKLFCILNRKDNEED